MSTFQCKCGDAHDWDDVHVYERLARSVDPASNSDKYWRVVTVSLPCRNVTLTHYGRWRTGWRNGGSFKVADPGAALQTYRRKLAGGYYPTDHNGVPLTGAGEHELTLIQHGGPHDDQNGNVLIAQADLQGGSAPSPKPEPSTPVPSTPVVDPVDVLTQRANTLATQIATAEQMTPEHAVERAELLAELATTQARLDQIESTLEMATAMMAAKH